MSRPPHCTFQVGFLWQLFMIRVVIVAGDVDIGDWCSPLRSTARPTGCIKSVTCRLEICTRNLLSAAFRLGGMFGVCSARQTEQRGISDQIACISVSESPMRRSNAPVKNISRQHGTKMLRRLNRRRKEICGLLRDDEKGLVNGE